METLEEGEVVKVDPKEEILLHHKILLLHHFKKVRELKFMEPKRVLVLKI
jgi:hypothetical protein